MLSWLPAYRMQTNSRMGVSGVTSSPSHNERGWWEKHLVTKKRTSFFLFLLKLHINSFLCFGGFHILSFSGWRPDPDAPFDSSLVPESLREQVNKFETTEVPSMGLMPRLLPASAPSTTPQQTSSSPAVQVDKQQPPPSELSHPSPPLPPPAAASRDYLVSWVEV